MLLHFTLLHVTDPDLASPLEAAFEGPSAAPLGFLLAREDTPGCELLADPDVITADGAARFVTGRGEPGDDDFFRASFVLSPETDEVATLHLAVSAGGSAPIDLDWTGDLPERTGTFVVRPAAGLMLVVATASAPDVAAAASLGAADDRATRDALAPFDLTTRRGRREALAALLAAP